MTDKSDTDVIIPTTRRPEPKDPKLALSLLPLHLREPMAPVTREGRGEPAPKDLVVPARELTHEERLARARHAADYRNRFATR